MLQLGILHCKRKKSGL